MVFPLSQYFFLFFLFIGAAIGCLICIPIGKITKRKYLRFRFSLSLLLFTVSVIFVVMVLLRLESQDNVFWYFRKHIVHSVCFFVTGFLCGVFLKEVLPVFTVLYIAFCIAFGFQLYRKYSLRPEAVTISVSENNVRTVDSFLPSFDYDFEKSSDENVCYLVFEETHLSEEIFLPFPHIWYKVCGVNENKGEFQEIGFQEKNFFTNIIENLEKKLIGKRKVVVLPVQKTEVYPVLYKLNFKTEADSFKPELKRIM